MSLFKIKEPKKDPVPIIISIPHSGTKFPSEIKRYYKKRKRKYLDDTDWFVHKLYDFAPSLGITVIKANYSRWVVDLNRDPECIPLYDDNRIITAMTPTTDFFGNNIYKSSELKPTPKEIERRLELYYQPYHRKIKQLLEERKRQFGKVLLWDAHSIRHRVSTIQKDVFPDMILGNNDQNTAHPELINTALTNLQSGKYNINHNSPFKGGHITRHFGNPDNNVHTLQLEMNKILYMDDNELTYNKERAKEVKAILQTTMEGLIETITSI
ncbi:N-formylglutamate amidohydrolase [Aquimarina sp. 2201CG5-10]|uniref:N-formylglutamate amidohydrolase n=1 Tax=Aquimarina callyspongiae TaxID=3098150 RepID=UPI002AB4691E|nr:N-formylglutamate amidohydrolase [Aquimarina sp. 2201CG5-10]MDY8136331.1 N-formylglutamate amidohydrolase [Aquimarina sp. 2201CG5-10]